MRQVPHYLIIGNGRVAQHFQQYFSLEKLSFSLWHRQSANSLNQELERATHVLLLISDRAIEPFIAEHLQDTKAIKLHFSGCLITDLAYGLHPLMTFSHKLYELDKYRSIPFIIDDDAPSFEALLPGLSNPHSRLQKSLKPKYHALCVMSGNFSCLLWQKLFTSLQQELNIPAAFAHHYLLQQTQNLLTAPETALTGPLVRNDEETINKNLQSLKDDPFQEVYQSFLNCYQKMKRELVQ